jgi:hypothetical protein
MKTLLIQHGRIKMVKYRLHEIEGALELYSSEPQVFKPAELYTISGDLRKELEKYNVYIVARRPRLSFVPSSLQIQADGRTVSGIVQAQVGMEQHSFKFSTNFPFNVIGIEDGEYPYDKLWLRTGPAGVIMRLFDVVRFSTLPLPAHTDLFVEYVGQAFGGDGHRDALDRLIGDTGKDGHGSLQKVLADVNHSRPDQEVHVLLFSYAYQKRFVVGGALFGNPKIPMDEAPDRLEQFMEGEVSRATRIDLVEASLIRYFRPAYNDKYKKTFPASSHVILNRMREMDVTGLAVSAFTTENAVRLYSEQVQPSDQHFALYPIVGDEQRASFFDLSF